jgi:1-acyl-sn-glycerol-3-phosphate acyltransferase
LGQIPDIQQEFPLLLLPNHSTWWDGFFVFLLNKKFYNRRLYLMMLEEQLHQFSFFSKVGAYSIEPSSLSGVKESLRYTMNILKQETGSDVLICIFPQGILSPWHKRPLEFKRGVETILAGYGEKVNIIPLGVKAIFLNEQHPQIFFKFGQCDVIDRLENIKFYEKQTEQVLQEILDEINRGSYGTTIFSGSLSISDRVTHIQNNLHHWKDKR